MYTTIKFIFMGLTWFFASLAIIFYIYLLITNPKEFFSNIFNPLILVYLFPSIACYWVADWANGKRITKHPEINEPETSLSDSSCEMQQDQELPLDHSESPSKEMADKPSSSGQSTQPSICRKCNGEGVVHLYGYEAGQPIAGHTSYCGRCHGNGLEPLNPTALKKMYGGIVFNPNNEVLVINPTGSDNTDRWVFPYGSATKNESSKDAALRNVYEYTGLQAEVIERIGVDEDFIFDDSARRYFLLKTTHKIEQELNGDKTRNMLWLPVKIAKDMISRNVNETERINYLEILRKGEDLYSKSIEKGISFAPVKTFPKGIIRSRKAQPNSPSINSRVFGCLLGGAVGDALGAPVEFMSWEQIKKEFGENGVTGYEEAYGRKGAITDDTQMTLFTAEALIRAENRREAKGVCNPAFVIRNSYFRWLLTQSEEPPIDNNSLNYVNTGWLVSHEFLHHRRAPGVTVLKALKSSERLTADNDSKGCGGVMRVAPIGLVAIEPFKLATEAARITHGHPTGYASAGAFAQAISSILNGWDIYDSIDLSRDYLREYPSPEEKLTGVDGLATIETLNAIEAVGLMSPLTVEKVESLGEGWVAEEALAIAFFCANRADDFLSGVLAAVNHSGDSDSTGSMCGSLLGALYGVEAIPQHLLDELEGREVIEKLSNDLIDKFIRNPDADSCAKDRYPPN